MIFFALKSNLGAPSVDIRFGGNGDIFVLKSNLGARSVDIRFGGKSEILVLNSTIWELGPSTSDLKEKVIFFSKIMGFGSLVQHSSIFYFFLAICLLLPVLPSPLTPLILCSPNMQAEQNLSLH